MSIPFNLIATGDDFGLSNSVNRAILYCFEQGYINSTSFLINTPFFDETVNLIHDNSAVYNIGVHINLAEGKPVTNFNNRFYLDEHGNWDFEKVNRKFNVLGPEAKNAFSKEICAQIDKALSNRVPLVHLDSHYHLHTLPCFYKLFLDAAKRYQLKIRIAQTYNEGNYLKYKYREYINKIFKLNDAHYSDYFETVNQFLNQRQTVFSDKVIEIMLHPDFDSANKLIDHVDNVNLPDWLKFLKQGDSTI